MLENYLKLSRLDLCKVSLLLHQDFLIDINQHFSSMFFIAMQEVLEEIEIIYN